MRLSGVSGGTSSSRRNETTPDQMPALVDDVEVEDHLDVARRLERRDRLAGRQVFGQREDVRVHQAAGGPLFVLEQLADAAAGLRPDQVEDDAAAVPRAGARSAAAASSDGNSWTRRAISSAERRDSSSPPFSGPSSLSASIASRPFFSTRMLNAAWRSFLGQLGEDLRRDPPDAASAAGSADSASRPSAGGGAPTRE